MGPVFRGGTLTKKDLFKAVKGGDREGVFHVLQSGVDIDSVENSTTKATALIIATRIESFDIVQLLCAEGASLNLKDAEGYTALMHACEFENEAIVDELLSQGALVNSEPGEYTALMVACTTGNFEIVDKLLEEGADPNAIFTDQNITALDIAREEGHDAIVELLESFMEEDNIAAGNIIAGAPHIGSHTISLNSDNVNAIDLDPFVDGEELVRLHKSNKDIYRINGLTETFRQGGPKSPRTRLPVGPEDIEKFTLKIHKGKNHKGKNHKANTHKGGYKKRKTRKGRK